jgi:hypothetical protein
MKQIQHITILALSITIFSSCTKEIDFDGKLLAPKLIVNSICMLDSAISAEVSESRPVPGYVTNFRMVKNATVKLFVDGIETEMLVYDSLKQSSQNNFSIPQSILYTGKTIAEKEKKYRIEVSESNYPTIVSGEMKMGGKIPIETIDTTINFLLNNDSGVRQKVKAVMRFTDPGNEKNYYRLLVSCRVGRNQSYINENTDTVKLVQVMDYIYNYSGIESDDPVFSSNENADEVLFGTTNSEYTIFTDEIFNGKSYDLKFNLKDDITYYFQDMNTDRLDFYVITIELQTLTQDVYYYLKSLNLSHANSGGLFMEPVQVYNNIKNGLGIFGGCSSSLYYIKKGNYPVDGVKYYYGSASY